MAQRGMHPEERFVRALFPGIFTQLRLPAIFASEAEMIRKELRQHIDAALSTLSYRERGILEMRFGLGDGYPYTLAEAGEVFKLTRERIRQLQLRAMKRLSRKANDLRDFLREVNSEQD